MAKILIVDDMRDFLEEQIKLLEEYGFPHELKTAVCPQAALELLSQEPFELVILDLKMAGKSGVELLHEIKRRFPQTKVIIYSAYVGDYMASELYKAGADDILTKPCPIDRFIRAIDAILYPDKDCTIVLIHGYDVKSIRSQVLPVIIQKALTKANRNAGRTAELLGVTRRCLGNMLKRFGIVR